MTVYASLSPSVGVCLIGLLSCTIAAADDSVVRMASAGLQYASSSGLVDDSHANYSADFYPKVRLAMSDQGQLRLDGRLSWLDQATEQKLDAEALNAYYAYRSDLFSIRLGRQSMVWGKADGINPTAFLSPYDYRSIYINDEDRRKALTALRIDMPLDENRMTLVVASKGVYNAIPLEADYRPWVSTSHRTAGAQVAWRYELQNYHGVDGAVTLFSGSALNQQMRFMGLSPASLPVYTRDAVDIRAIGLDGATNVGNYGLRAEMAYVDYADHVPSQQGQPLQSYAAAVFGIDRLYNDWHLGTQGVVIYTPHFATPVLTGTWVDLASTYNAIVNNQTQSTQYGLSVNLSTELDQGKIKPELNLIHFISSNSTYLKSSVEFMALDHQSILLGTELFAGGKDTFFGSLRRNNKVVLRYKYYF